MDLFDFIPTSLTALHHTIPSRVQMSKSDMFLVNLSSTADSVDSMRSARRVMGNTSLDPKPFSYSPAFVFFEQVLSCLMCPVCVAG